MVKSSTSKIIISWYFDFPLNNIFSILIDMISPGTNNFFIHPLQKSIIHHLVKINKQIFHHKRNILGSLRYVIDIILNDISSDWYSFICYEYFYLSNPLAICRIRLSIYKQISIYKWCIYTLRNFSKLIQIKCNN